MSESEPSETQVNPTHNTEKVTADFSHDIKKWREEDAGYFGDVKTVTDNDANNLKKLHEEMGGYFENEDRSNWGPLDPANEIKSKGEIPSEKTPRWKRLLSFFGKKV